MILYGLPTCSDCNKARKALEAAGHDLSFRDIRAEPLSVDERTMLIAEFGSRIIDQSTNTWRGLSAWMKASEAEDQLAAHPALMARPVIHDATRMTLGWSDEVQTIWGVSEA